VAPTAKTDRLAPPKAGLAGIGSDAVRQRTGKGWADWLKILDKAGARRMAHRDIALYLYKKHRVPGWWAQMITVGYEQARGMRQVHQKPGGFEISGSKTVAAPLSALYRAWTTRSAWRRWLAKPNFTIRKARANKSLRITWGDGRTSLDVNFYPKGKGKSMVAVQHGKLASAKDAARMKKFWAAQLEKLKKVVEK
jgi:uncharacterized protein YndB with AHSA1/START domain